MKTNRTSASLITVLVITAAASLPFFIGKASAPGITEIAETFTPVTLSPMSQNPIPANLAGGVIDFVTDDDQCGTTSLRIVTDTDRIATVLGNAIPSNGYILLTQPSVSDPNNGCNTPNPNYTGSHPLINSATAPPIGAYDVDANTLRVIIPYLQTESGCTFTNQLGGPCCTPGQPEVDLNGDGDFLDNVVF
jgi:hypothetical protein